MYMDEVSLGARLFPDRIDYSIVRAERVAF